VPVYAEVKVHRDYHVQIDRACTPFRNICLGNNFRPEQTRSWLKLVKLFHRG
jgi:hypothetical protein